MPYTDSPWGCKESDTTERLNWTDILIIAESWGSKVRLNYYFFNIFLIKSLKTDTYKAQLEDVITLYGRWWDQIHILSVQTITQEK